MSTPRPTTLLRLGLAAFFIAAGAMHFAKTELYVEAVPDALPAPRLLVHVSGAAEVAGGIGLLLPPPVRRFAAIGLIALLVAVFPANVAMALDPASAPIDAPAWVLWARLPLQPLLMWLVWRSVREPR